MKVLTIIGTTHEGNTKAIVELFKEELKDALFDTIVLPTDMPQFCYGCANCILKSEDKCPHYNKITPLLQKVDDADLIIIATPVFVGSCTSGLKAFLDHMAYRWLVHRPSERMFNKVGLIITTSGGSGVKATVKLLKQNMNFWGISKVYNYGVTTMKMSGNYVDYKNKDKIKRQVHRKANIIKKSFSNNKVSLKIRFLYSIFRMSQKNGWNKADVDYWRKKGWLGKKRPF